MVILLFSCFPLLKFDFLFIFFFLKVVSPFFIGKKMYYMRIKSTKRKFSRKMNHYISHWIKCVIFYICNLLLEHENILWNAFREINIILLFLLSYNLNGVIKILIRLFLISKKFRLQFFNSLKKKTIIYKVAGKNLLVFLFLIHLFYFINFI